MDTETYVDPHVTEYGKHLIGNHSIFSIIITKTLTNAVKSYLDKKKTHNGTPSEPEPAPQHPFKKSGEPSLKSVLYNYSLFFLALNTACPCMFAHCNKSLHPLSQQNIKKSGIQDFCTKSFDFTTCGCCKRYFASPDYFLIFREQMISKLISRWINIDNEC